MGDVLTKRKAIGTPDETTTRYRYTAAGELKSVETDVTASSTAMVEIEYDALGNKTRLDDPDKGLWRYEFNGFGELVCQTNEKGEAVVNRRDNLGRLLNRWDIKGLQGSELDPDNCSSWITASGDILLPGQAVVASETHWEYGVNQAGSALSEFGQVLTECTISDEPISGFETCKDYEYDSQGRVRSVITRITNLEGANSRCVDDPNQTAYECFEERVTYDAIGRVFQKFDASSEFSELSPYDDPIAGSHEGGRGQQFQYGSSGHLIAIKEAWNPSASTTYWQAGEADARGNSTFSTLGNGMELRSDYDPATGELTHRVEESPDQHNRAIAQVVGLTWDRLGRLQDRMDLSLATTEQHEHFEYDSRNRLTEVWRSPTGGTWPSSSWERTLAMSYQASGNISHKSDVGSYTYYDSGSEIRPHAVETAGGRSFQYDALGNVSGDGERTFSYTAFSKLARVEMEIDFQAEALEFAYGPDRSRYYQRHTASGSTEAETLYIGNVEVFVKGDVWEYRRSVGDRVLVTVEDDVTVSGDEVTRTRYLHRDHIGSLVAVSDETGYVVARMSYDAWGQRRSPEYIFDSPSWDQWNQLMSPAWVYQFGEVTQYTPRGFTGHEHLDRFGIIHMIGRIYDPHLARFLQADPFVEDSTTLNRYTYVHNNPLALTDPTGYFSNEEWVRMIGSVAISMFTGGLVQGLEGWAAFGTAVAGGAASGAVATGSTEGALWGAFSAMAFYAVSDIAAASGTPKDGGFLGSGLRTDRYIARAVFHGMSSGMLSELQGGKFGHGFASAGLSSLSSAYVASVGETNRVAQGAISAIVGGTASELSGGKFANGAATAAMAYAMSMYPDDSMARSSGAESGEGDSDLIHDIESGRLVEEVYADFPSLPKATINFVEDLADVAWYKRWPGCSSGAVGCFTDDYTIYVEFGGHEREFVKETVVHELLHVDEADYEVFGLRGAYRDYSLIMYGGHNPQITAFEDQYRWYLMSNERRSFPKPDINDLPWRQ
jgi:RHS repeat-associated protein